MNQIQAARIKAAKTRTFIERTRAALPEIDRAPFSSALAGTINTFDLWHLVREQNRAAVLISVYLSGCPADRWREAMQINWLGGHRALSDVAKAASVNLTDMFRAARFPIPPDLPETLTM